MRTTVVRRATGASGRRALGAVGPSSVCSGAHLMPAVGDGGRRELADAVRDLLYEVGGGWWTYQWSDRPLAGGPHRCEQGLSNSLLLQTDCGRIRIRGARRFCRLVRVRSTGSA
ncbi:hypothetical protein GCM10020229_39380 [Kitasatospora albolonga]